MKTIVVAGHTCVDITPVFPSQRTYESVSDILIPGKLIQMEGVDVHTGGAVSNTGLALKILGNDVRLLGKIGEDSFGKIVRDIFLSYGADGLITDPEGVTSYTAVLAVPGNDRIFLHAPGENDTFSSEDVSEDSLKGADLFHFGYPPLMRKMYENAGDELVKLFRRVKNAGLATSLDFAAIDPNSDAGKADWMEILKKVLPFVDFFVPSFEELCFMLDRPRYEQLAKKGGDMTDGLDLATDVMPLAERLLAMGCGVVLIKCGASGMLFRTSSKDRLREIGDRIELDLNDWAERCGIQPIFEADIVRSGTGAGDASIAAFLTAVIEGKTPAESVALAAAEGACCVTELDALSGLKTLSELEERIRKGWKQL